MKKKWRVLLFTILCFIGIAIIAHFTKEQPIEVDDEDILYSQQFGNVILKFKRYDYALGQNWIVGVLKSTDNGNSYVAVTDEAITVSYEARFRFLNESLGFVISTGYVSRSNEFLGLLVTQDGGKTFLNAKFNYDNEEVDLITILDFPSYEGDTLKLPCSIYTVKEDKSGYEDVEILFYSFDNGLTWNYEK